MWHINKNKTQRGYTYKATLHFLTGSDNSKQ